MKKPLVSVIIPNYNSQKTIKLCLSAICNQTYGNKEIIVIDDGSTDNSIEILKEYECQIFTTPKSSSGPSTARNLGATMAKGSILFFVDSDIALYPDAIEQVVAAFSEDNSIGSVCGIYAKTPLINDSLLEEYRTLQGYYWRKSSEGFVTPMFFSLGAVRKYVFEEIGELNTKLKDAEDLEYGCRLNRKYKLLLTSKVLGQHDDEDKLFPALKKFFHRSRYRVPIYLKWGKLMKGFETPNRAMGALFAACSCITLCSAIFSLWALPISLLLFSLFLLCDKGQYKFVYEEKGVKFLIYFIFIHFIINVNIFLGVAKGYIDWILNKKFREKFNSI